MPVKVYSAAKATFPLKGQAREQAWKTLTEMFRDPHASSYQRGHWPIDPVIVDDDGPNVGAVFFCFSGMGSNRFVEIKEWKPLESFSYESAYPRNIDDIVDRTDIPGTNAEAAKKAIAESTTKRRMDFSLAARGADTIVTIVRREKADVGMFGGKKNLAKENLEFILGSNIAVERADHLRNNF